MANDRERSVDARSTNVQYNKRGGVFSPRGNQVATTLYAGSFLAGSGGYTLWNTSSWSDFTTQNAKFVNDGLRLVSIDTDEQDGETWFLGAWAAVPGGWGLWRSSDWGSFQQQFDAWSNGVKLLDIDIHASGGTRYFTGTWGGSPVKQTLAHDLEWKAFTAKWKDLSENGGMRLVKAQVYPSAGPDLWTGLFEAGSGAYAFEVTTDWAEFDGFVKKYQSMQLVDFQVYDSPAAMRWYVGVWRETPAVHAFKVGLDWGSFVHEWNALSQQGMRLQKAIRYPNPVQVPEPKWAAVFSQALDGKAMGYAYRVAKHGVVVAEGQKGYARAPQDAPPVSWGQDARINLASVSKSVTAVSVIKLLHDKHRSVDDAFYPFIKTKVPTVAAGIDTITIRNLLTMKSGMVAPPNEGPLSGDLWPYLNTYLQQGLVGTPGVTYAYSNTNFTILQGLIEQLSGTDYVTYVTQNVLVPMGISAAEFSPAPAQQTLDYSTAADTRPGQAWGTFTFVAPGGWVTTADALMKFLIGVRKHTVLGREATLRMLNGDEGWYTYDGIYGQYFHHNGGLGNGLTPPQGVATGIIRLTDGYDALLLVNSLGQDVIALMVQAFESR